MRRVAAVVMSCLLGAALLTGCGRAETKPAPHEAPSASPSPTVSPAPTMPAAAKEAGAKGAEAFVRHYVELMNHAQATGDVAPMKAASSSTCVSCERTFSYITDIYSGGGSIDGGEIRVSKVYAVVVSPDTDGLAAVDVRLRIASAVVRDGEDDRQGKSASQDASFQLAHDGSWRITEWTRTK